MARRKRTAWGHIWRIALCVILCPLVLLVLAALLISIPGIQRFAVAKAQAALKDQLGIEASIGKVKVKPLLDLSMEDILAMDEAHDTLVWAKELVLKTDLKTLRDSVLNIKEFHFHDVKADSKDLIGAVTIKGSLDRLNLCSDTTAIIDGKTHVNALLIKGVDLDITLHETEEEAKDTTSSKPFTWDFDVSEAALEDIHVSINPIDIDVDVDRLDLIASVALGETAGYHADSLVVDKAKVRVGTLDFDIDKVDLQAAMDSTFIDVKKLYARSGPMSAEGKATLDLETMLLDADIKASSKRSSAAVKGTLSILDQVFNAAVDINGLTVNDIVPLDEICQASGRISVDGKGFDPMAHGTDIHLHALVDSCRYGDIRASRTALRANATGGIISGNLDTAVYLEDSTMAATLDGIINFSASALNSKKPSLNVNALLDGAHFANDSLEIGAENIVLKAATDRKSTMLDLSTDGLALHADAPAHALDIVDRLTTLADAFTKQLDSLDIDIEALKELYPDLGVKLKAGPGNPLESFLADKGLSFSSLDVDADLSPVRGLNASAGIKDICKDTLSLSSAEVILAQEGNRLDCKADAAFLSQHGLPDVNAGLDGWLAKDEAQVRLKASSDIKDGILSVKGISSLVGIDLTARMLYDDLSAEGMVNLGRLSFQGTDFGDRSITMKMLPLGDSRYDIYADTDDIPVSLAKSFLEGVDVDLGGNVRASLNARGSLDSLHIHGTLTPESVSVCYRPFDVNLRLGDVPISLDDMKVTVPDLPIYAADSTFAVLSGGCDLDSLLLDFRLASDNFKPAPLEKKDSIPFFGNLAAAIDARVHGTPDDLAASGQVDILPQTDITFMIDKKNYVKAKADGSVKFDYTLGGDIDLHGKVNVDEGQIAYSPALYPLQPFNIKPGSYVAIDGPLSSLDLNLTATQPTKAIVSDVGERSREVDFIVGVQVKNGLENLGLDFLIEAPKDSRIQKEIADFSQEERNRVAAALLATGMYISDSNASMNESGYALASIMQRSANALAKNKLGNVVDIDLGVGKTNSGAQYTTNYTMTVSKKFFDDRLKLTVGGRVSDNSQSGGNTKTTAGIDNLSAEFLLKKGGNTSLEVFHKRDYENIMEGELTKDGLGVKTYFEWQDKEKSPDPFSLGLQGNLSYRSNNQLGPNLSATFSKTNLFHNDETFSAKVHGAYYWKVGEKRTAALAQSDSYQIGVDLNLSYPRLMLPGVTRRGNSTSVTTDFGLGYLFEDISGSCFQNKFTANVNYAFHTGRHITHMFSPFSLSLIACIGTDEYYEKMAKNVNGLFKSLLENEHIPAMQYRFIYDDSFETDKAVTTRIDATVKESGNLISGIQAIFGKNFNEKYKSFILPYDQFVKLNLELRHHFRIGEKSCLATRFISGINLAYGNSYEAPNSEAFYVGGPNSIRAFAARSIGPGSYYDKTYNLPMYHSGDIKAEANIEYRFPLFWMLEGAVFVDAGNVWSAENSKDALEPLELEYFKELGWTFDFDDGIVWDKFWQQTALGTGFGVRFVFQSIVVRLDTGIAIHAPFNTGKSGYYNIPHFFKDGMRLNFGIGYPF